MTDPDPPTAPPPSPPEPTLLDLLLTAQSAEMAREHNRRVLDQATARSSVSGYSLGVQIAALSAGDPWADVPAALAIRAFTNREYGQDFTPDSVRRVRGRVCDVLKIDTAAADALPLGRVAEVLTGTAASTTDPAADPRWLRVTDVARLIRRVNVDGQSGRKGDDELRGSVSRWCSYGTFVTNGKTGTERRVDAVSVVHWLLSQAE